MKYLSLVAMVALSVACSCEAESRSAGIDAEESDVTKTCECRPRNGLPNVLAKLKAGKAVRIAYLGGSITEAGGWRPMTLEWFRSAFPQAKVEEIHAAISGTGSDYGAIRLPGDVLCKKPDLLFVEFRVNGSAGYDYQSTEGIVRQTFAADPTTDICFVYTLCEAQMKDLTEGRQTKFGEAMERVCDHYGIPSIDFAPEIVRRMKDPTTFAFKPTRRALKAEAIQMDGRADGFELRASRRPECGGKRVGKRTQRVLLQADEGGRGFARQDFRRVASGREARFRDGGEQRDRVSECPRGSCAARTRKGRAVPYRCRAGGRAHPD